MNNFFCVQPNSTPLPSNKTRSFEDKRLKNSARCINKIMEIRIQESFFQTNLESNGKYKFLDMLERTGARLHVGSKPICLFSLQHNLSSEAQKQIVGRSLVEQ
jgi:CRISPR/Cas system-associated endoribonuclease Cas2